MKLRFITEELAFENDGEAAQFVIDHAGDTATDLLPEREGQIRLLTSKVGQVFDHARTAAFRSVDIKGQI